MDCDFCHKRTKEERFKVSSSGKSATKVDLIGKLMRVDIVNFLKDITVCTNFLPVSGFEPTTTSSVEKGASGSSFTPSRL